MQTFKRQQFNQLWTTLQSNETLGVLDSDFIEDYYGTDGQVSLYKVSDETRTPVLMNPVPQETPETINDVFSGYIDLSELEDGLYRIQGAVRDVTGNITVLSSSLNRSGQVIPFEISITSHQVVVNFPVPATINMGILFSLPIQPKTVSFDLSIKKGVTITTKFRKSGTFLTSIVKYLRFNTKLEKGVSFSPSINKSLQLDANIDILQ